jgi:carbamoyltransferase
MDIASSIQAVTEEIVLTLGRSVHQETGETNLCLAGGVALNCVANGRLMREGPFENIWIQPAAGDAGGALGAALSAWHEYAGNPRQSAQGDSMRGAYLGPRFSSEDVCQRLDALGAVYQRLDDTDLLPRLASLLAEEQVVGWMQGPMEFGPRALGGRSILGDARSRKMQSVMNLKIKYRESFRPFAPAVLAERAAEFFDIAGDSPYMLQVAPVKEALRLPDTAEQQMLQGLERLNTPRSSIPAVTHVDFSARVQTVHAGTNPRFHGLLEAFERKTGSGILVNTSFNVRGEPIVCTPEDAYRCFMSTEMDYLVIEDCLLAKTEQPETSVDRSWMDQLAGD